MLCPAGTYNVNGNSTCLECPNGGYCPGGSEVDTIYGWWQNSNSLLNSNTSLRAVSMMRCTGSTCCKSNTSCSIQETCSGNTTGSLCSTCASSEYKLWDNQCVFCKTINGAYMVIFIIIAFAIVLFYALISGGGANVFLPNITFTIQVLGVVNTVSRKNHIAFRGSLVHFYTFLQFY